jgi:LacI family gluconate utilization system Gnt-I transcriptional repressor
MATAETTPKLEDVARRAGVSTATVSRFINNPEIVARGTAEKIRTAIDEMGYIPNLLAGALAGSRSRLVAVLIPHLTSSIFNDTIEAMAEELTAAGTTVMLGLTGVQTDRTVELIRTAVSRRADAIISTGPVDDSIRDLVRRCRIPFIQMWELPDDPVDIAVGFSHRDAGRDIARFLLTRGYQRPHLVTANGSRAAIRSSGFLEEWRSHGGLPPTEASVEIPSSFGHARRLFADMRRLDNQPDVVVCGSDYLAMGLIVEAQAAGLRIPEEMAVIGFGNAAVAGEMRPTITTVDIDGRRIAREAIAALQRRTRGEQGQHRIDVGFRLIARESA